MKIPSATGIVFASLALSGSTLAAPTGVPSSPNPNSPNPGLNSPRHELDSPRFANSPDMNSPRAMTHAFFMGRSRPQGRVRRPMARKRDASSGNDAQSVQADGLGILPGGLADAGNQLVDSVGGILETLPLGSTLAPLVTQTGHAVIGLLSPDEKPVAAPMQRSLAQFSIRDDATMNAEGLGLLDQETAGTLKGTVHGLTEPLEGIPVVGVTVANTVEGIADGVVDVLGPAAVNTPTRRTIPHWMRRRQTASPDTIDGTVTAEGLGLVSPEVGKQLSDALHGVGDTLSGLVPIAGPVLGGVIGTVGDLLSGLITRDGGVVMDVDADVPTSRRYARSAGSGPFPEFDNQDIPGSVYQQLPANTAYGAASQGYGMASQYLPEGVSSMQPQVVGEYVGQDGRIYEEFSQGFPQAMQMAPQPVGDAGRQAYGTTRQGAGQFLGQGSQAGGAMGMAGGMLGGATEFIPGLGNVAYGALPQSISGNIPNIIGYLPNGLPVFGSAPATSSYSQGGGQQQQQPQGGLGGLGQIVSGATGAASGVMNGTPLGGIFNGVAGTIANGPAGGVVGTAKSMVNNVPVVGGLANGLVGSLPGFGILSNPDTAPSMVTTSSSMPSGTPPSTGALTGSGTSSSTAASTASGTPTSIASTGGASGAEQPEGAADGDGSGDDEDGGDDSDGDDEGKDGTDSNDVGAPVPSEPASSSIGSTVMPSATSTGSSSASQATPTASIPL